MNPGRFASLVALGLIGCVASPIAVRSPVQATPLGPPGFHHLHMSSPNPSAAIDELIRVYPGSRKVTVAGFEGLETANHVFMLFGKVNAPPPAPGPDRVSEKAPQTAFWHHVWTVKDGRAALKALREADSRFDASRFIPQYTGRGGGKVDFSSDTISGFLTSKDLDEALKKGAQPTHRGGYFNWYGPDGVVMETAEGPDERYTIVGMFQEQPYCALFWYRRYLNAPDRPTGGRGPTVLNGRGTVPPDVPASEADCKVSRRSDVSWPSTYKRGHYRVPPPQLVVFGDVTLRWYMNQENRPLVSTRGQLMDHIALSVGDLDAWVEKLTREHVKFLMAPYTLGDTRAAMIEGPSLEAIELVEEKP